MIPQLIHFIWFGGFPKKILLQNIQNIKELHPGYECHLWSSPRTLKAEDWAKLQTWCRDNEVILCNVDDEQGLVNKEIIEEILTIGAEKVAAEKSYDEYTKKVAIECWRAAADLLKIAVMLKYAGFYLDPRTQISQSLSTIEVSPDHDPGFLLDFGKEGPEGKSWSTEFHIFAAIRPNLDIFKIELVPFEKSAINIGILCKK